MGFTLKTWNKQFGEIENWSGKNPGDGGVRISSPFLGKTYQDTARLCGLLHNLGQIIMLSHPQVRKSTCVLKYIQEHGVDFVEAERAVIGFSHPLIGAMVACKWQLPMSICNTILAC